MHKTLIEWTSEAGPQRGYVAPATGPVRGGVVVLQEWWGLVPHITSVCDRFAAAGFTALAPDLYAGEQCTAPDAAERMMMQLNIAAATHQVAAAGGELQARLGPGDPPVAVLGFCMGGQLALHAACTHPKRFAAVVDFYGVHPKVEPPLSALEAPVLAHFGKDDAFVPQDTARQLVQALMAAGKQVEAHFYDAGHAFFNDTRPEAYNAPSAASAWQRTLAFLNAHLPSSAAPAAP